MKLSHFAVSAFLALGFTQQALGESITFVSDTTWQVADSGGTSLGSAQYVCLNSFVPASCPAGATSYEYPAGWTADLTSIPGAAWIWAPGVTASTSAAYPAQFLFSKSFEIGSGVLGGSIALAADDFAEVFVNGTSVGTVGSTTDGAAASAAQSSITTFDISSWLLKGTNIISIGGVNGPFGCSGGAYSCNPAGVVFGGEIFTALVPLPNTLTLFLIGLGGLSLTGVRRRRHP